METTDIVTYEARITNPDGQPAETGGPPDGQGPPSDAAPSSVVENVLSKTPARTDTRLKGVSTDADGNPTGQPPAEYVVEDRVEPDTGDRVTTAMLPAASEADAAALFDDLKADVTGADAHTLRHYKSPTGTVSTEEVQEWYRNHPDQQPTDENGDPYIPETWDPERHVVSESTA